jgi:sortase A
VTLPSHSGEDTTLDDGARGGVTVSEPSDAPGPAEPEPDLSAADSPEAEAAAPAAAKVKAPVPASVAIYGAAMSILAALLLGFLADLTVVGALHHNRDQHVEYANLRLALANGIGPIGPADYDGVLLRPGTPVALLQIPEIGLNEVVLEGTTSGVLMKGAVHLRTTPMPGQAGVSEVMGRLASYGGPFRDIATLRPGATFSVTTGQGKNVFTVLDVRHTGDPNPPLPSGESRVVLVTASGPALRPTGVVHVDAELTSTVQPTPPPFSGIPRLTDAERPLRGDSSVLGVLVLWGQALVIAAGLVAWARMRWGRWQTWIVGLPLLATLGLAVADPVAQLLPNLM